MLYAMAVHWRTLSSRGQQSKKTQQIRLHYFIRKPRAQENFSIERLFDAIISALPEQHFAVRRLICPFYSNGIFRRILLVVWAALHQGDINHVTGDVDFLCLLMRRRSTVVTIHDIGSLHRLRGFRRRLYETFWLRLPLYRADEVTTASETSRAEIQRFAPRARHIRVIPNCFSKDIQIQPKPFRCDLPRILQVGTRPNKNLERVISALRGLHCELVVVGKLTLAQSNLLDRCGIRYENHVNLSDSALLDQYRSADLVVFMSTYEGFGLPILEAQAIGRPIVTSNREPMRSVAGTGARTVDPFDTDEIRRGIEDVIRSPALRKTLIEAGRRNVERYSPASIASQYASLYLEMYRA